MAFEEKEEDESENLFDGEVDYKTKGDFSKAAKVSEQISRILTLRSVDLRPGYTSWFTDKTGTAKPVIVPDSRKAYCGAIIILKLLLKPEIENESNFKILVNKFEEEEKRLFNKLAYREKVMKYLKNGEIKWEYTGNVYMPELGDVLTEPTNTNEQKTTQVTGWWDSQVNIYWNNLVKLCDNLFGDLNSLIHELKYFDIGDTF